MLPKRAPKLSLKVKEMEEALLHLAILVRQVLPQ